MTQASYTVQTATAAITQLYEEIDGRLPDAVGLEGWINALLGGESLASVRYSFSTSTEIQTKLDLAYYAIFDVPLPSAQLLQDESALNKGATLAQVIAPLESVANSEILFLCHNEFGYAPNASFLATYSESLLTGTPLTTIQTELAFSTSAATALSTAYANAYGSLLTGSQLIADQYLLSVGYSVSRAISSQINTAQQEVISIYQDVFNAPPTASQIVNKSLLILQGMTPHSLLAQLANSSNATTALSAAYFAAFGTAPSQSELDDAQSEVAAGSSLDELQTSWDTNSVNQLYQNVLGRGADAGGIEGFVSAMLSGETYEQILDIFATGSEATADLENAYAGANGSTMNSEQLAAAQSQLESGQTLAQVEAPWVSQAQNEITSLYENILERFPDQGGLTGYTNALESGDTLESIREIFSYSSEAAADLSQAYENAYSQKITSGQLAAAQAALASGESILQVEAPWYAVIPGSTTPPQVWLAAVDPFVESATGADTTADYMNLFGEYTTWASQVSVFKISTQFALWGSAQQLETVFSYLNSHHIALAMEGLMLPSTPGSTVGQGVEGFNGPPGYLGVAAQRIESLGGNLQYIAMDEPLYFAHQYTGTNGPQWSIATVAQAVAVNIAAVKEYFPDVKVGDIEPTPGTNDLKIWAADFQAAVGQPLAFFDADVPWTQGPYLGGLEQVAGQFRQIGVPFGVIINGNGQDTTDSAWVNAAEQRLATIEADPLIRPDQLIVQTWGPNPTQAGPEGTEGSLTNLLGNVNNADTYFDSASFDNEQADTISLSGPAALSATVGIPALISGLNLGSTTPSSGSMQVGVVLLADVGQLSTLPIAGVQVHGNGTSALSLLGSLVNIESELSNLTYEDSTAGIDHLSITVYEGVQAPVSYDLAITVQSSSGNLQNEFAISHSSAISGAILTH